MPAYLPDDEVRAAAIAYVQRLREQYGGRIPRESLSEGIVLRGERVPIWNYQKGIFKPGVLGPGGAALSVQTSAESPYADEHDPDSGHFVYKYRGTDTNHYDNVALRNAMLSRRPIIYLVAVDPGFYDAIAPVYVTDDDPALLQFTLMADQVVTPPTTSDEVVVSVRRAYATRAVMQRLHQQRFRRLVLDAYSGRCTICRLRHRELLDAAHILADRDPRGEAMIPNGLGLCKIHHAAYDANILGITPDAKVEIRADVLEEKDGPMLQYGLQAANGNRLVLPRRLEHQPNRDFLAERYERFLAA